MGARAVNLDWAVRVFVRYPCLFVCFKKASIAVVCRLPSQDSDVLSALGQQLHAHLQVPIVSAYGACCSACKTWLLLA
jgi:hypothetical protein